MAISDSLNKRLRARRDEEEDEFDEEILSDEMEDIEEDAESNSDGEEDNSNSDAAESEEDDDEDDEDQDISDTQSIQSANDREAIQSEFRQISFGALAKAQNSIGKKRKRGAEDKAEDQTNEKKPSSTLDEIRERLRIARERKLGLKANSSNTQNNNEYSKPKPPPRTSKHAPAVQSSKIAVSRKRTIIEPTTTKSRDPRFDPTVVKSSSSARRNNSSAENAYAFLDEYRASEIKQLKEQLAKTKDAAQKEELKRAITSATDRQRTLENRKREREVLQEHKRKEKQLIKEGKKSQPYFLKKSELKREVLKKKYESMGSKERAKALERRRKKVASKEKKDLPWARRGMEN
ncbi:rRNA biogenesis protein rrp36 [Talaromyces pinophilus]|nr:rRNA biogenesis protein rrp36 [Talaromyces pinophilus]